MSTLGPAEGFVLNCLQTKQDDEQPPLWISTQPTRKFGLRVCTLSILSFIPLHYTDHFTKSQIPWRKRDLLVVLGM